jgi:hypothetical protein
MISAALGAEGIAGRKGTRVVRWIGVVTKKTEEGKRSRTVIVS